MAGFENIEVWLKALDRLHEKQQTIKCVNCPDDWKEELEEEEE